jgi:hypothetical protein
VSFVIILTLATGPFVIILFACLFSPQATQEKNHFLFRKPNKGWRDLSGHQMSLGCGGVPEFLVASRPSAGRVCTDGTVPAMRPLLFIELFVELHDDEQSHGYKAGRLSAVQYTQSHHTNMATTQQQQQGTGTGSRKLAEKPTLLAEKQQDKLKIHGRTLLEFEIGPASETTGTCHPPPRRHHQVWVAS